MVSSKETNSFEFPVMLHVPGEAPVMGIIEQVTASDAYFRSLVSFPVGTRLTFELIHGGTHAHVTGTVRSVRDAAPRRHYWLELTSDGSDVDALATITADLRARRAAPKPVAGGGALARASVRAPVDFPIGYAVEGGGYGTGHAANISTGGLLMTCEEGLVVGATLELSFTLELASSRKEISTHARVVAHQYRETRWAIHLAFFNVDPAVKALIGEYVDGGT